MLLFFRYGYDTIVSEDLRVYTTVQSLYCYPDSDVLKNKLNIIRPFNEGNGRTIRELIWCMALSYGFTLDWSHVDRG